MVAIYWSTYRKLKEILAGGYQKGAALLAELLAPNPVLLIVVETLFFVLKWSLNKVLDSFDILFDPYEKPTGPYKLKPGEKYVPFKYFDPETGKDVTARLMKEGNHEDKEIADKIEKDAQQKIYGEQMAITQKSQINNYLRDIEAFRRIPANDGEVHVGIRGGDPGDAARWNREGLIPINGQYMNPTWGRAGY